MSSPAATDLPFAYSDFFLRKVEVEKNGTLMTLELEEIHYERDIPAEKSQDKSPPMELRYPPSTSSDTLEWMKQNDQTSPEWRKQQYRVSSMFGKLIYNMQTKQASMEFTHGGPFRGGELYDWPSHQQFGVLVCRWERPLTTCESYPSKSWVLKNHVSTPLLTAPQFHEHAAFFGFGDGFFPDFAKQLSVAALTAAVNNKLLTRELGHVCSTLTLLPPPSDGWGEEGCVADHDYEAMLCKRSFLPYPISLSERLYRQLSLPAGHAPYADFISKYVSMDRWGYHIRFRGYRYSAWRHTDHSFVPSFYKGHWTFALMAHVWEPELIIQRVAPLLCHCKHLAQIVALYISSQQTWRQAWQAAQHLFFSSLQSA